MFIERSARRTYFADNIVRGVAASDGQIVIPDFLEVGAGVR
jgi:hypothetical protein